MTTIVKEMRVRVVCKKRARFLKRRGEDVRYVGISATGKSLWHWFRIVSLGELKQTNLESVK